jgi:hypothetical protein
VARHLRFALTDVTFAGEAMPGATVDSWDDDGGDARWIARIVMRRSPIADEGVLAGKTRDGRTVSGAVVVDRQGDPGARREIVVEFHGSGELLRPEPEAT